MVLLASNIIVPLTLGSFRLNLKKSKQNRRLIIVICMTYTNGDIKAMCTPVCVVIIYSSAKQYTQYVFAF